MPRISVKAIVKFASHVAPVFLTIRLMRSEITTLVAITATVVPPLTCLERKHNPHKGKHEAAVHNRAETAFFLAGLSHFCGESFTDNGYWQRYLR